MTDTDREFVARAIELASNGLGHVHPNPVVGAVVVRDGEVLGEGWHATYGGAHAEVEALRACGDADTAAATLYVSLEPCCHQGKTPPCTDAIVAAGVTRVVVASDDPSEKASGRGLGILRDEGVEVVVVPPADELARQARLANQAFRKHARTGRPWVLFKSAMTLDGKVATPTGDSKWISGESSRARAHRWRSTVDAVAVGIGTALADDPQLTARIDAVARQPIRVVFDSTARLPVTSQLVRDALDRLGELGIASLLLEGGPHLAGAFFDAGEIDEARLFLAPLLLGGRSARDPLEGQGVEQIADALRAETLTCERVAEDLLVSARLREW